MNSLNYILNSFFRGITTIGFFSVVFYLVFWRLLGRKLIKRRFRKAVRIDDIQLRHEILYTLLTVLSFSVFEWLLFLLSANGYTATYINFDEYPILYWLSSILILFCAHDTWFYWSHRLLHLPSVYKLIHHVHHKSRDTTPFTAFSMHPMEALILNFWVLPIAIWVPVHFLTFVTFQFVSLILNLIAHLGVELYPKTFLSGWLRFKTTSTHHHLHHNTSRSNYGLYFVWWDRWMKTESKEYKAAFKRVTD